MASRLRERIVKQAMFLQSWETKLIGNKSCKPFPLPPLPPLPSRIIIKQSASETLIIQLSYKSFQFIPSQKNHKFNAAHSHFPLD
jgi:hypothetical protein